MTELEAIQERVARYRKAVMVLVKTLEYYADETYDHENGPEPAQMAIEDVRKILSGEK